MTYPNSTGPDRFGDTPRHGDAVEFDLFNQPADEPEQTPVVRSIIAGRNASLTDRFESWLADNQAFYKTLVLMARQFLSETGSNKLGIQQLIEAARWNHAIRTRSIDFKINNDYGAFLARLLMHNHPDLRDVFETRRSDEADAWITSLIGKAA